MYRFTGLIWQQNTEFISAIPSDNCIFWKILLHIRCQTL